MMKCSEFELRNLKAQFPFCHFVCCRTFFLIKCIANKPERILNSIDTVETSLRPYYECHKMDIRLIHLACLDLAEKNERKTDKINFSKCQDIEWIVYVNHWKCVIKCQYYVIYQCRPEKKMKHIKSKDAFKMIT